MGQAAVLCAVLLPDTLSCLDEERREARTPIDTRERKEKGKQRERKTGEKDQRGREEEREAVVVVLSMCRSLKTCRHADRHKTQRERERE